MPRVRIASMGLAMVSYLPAVGAQTIAVRDSAIPAQNPLTYVARAAVADLPLPQALRLATNPASAGRRAAADSAVAGVVVEAQSQRPLPLARVAVEGTDKSVQTNSEGRFVITGLSGTEVTLQVRLIGYQPATARVAVGEGNVRILLQTAVLELDEVVVTGTAGAQQKRELGNSVAQVRASDIVETAPVTDVGQLLNGRAAGVVVRQPSGVVGAGASISIRGRKSLSLAGNPLIYVDGVRIDNSFPSPGGPSHFQVTGRLNDINPEDIESIEIIKGPSAATLYGTEAANGVVQIITKRGASGRPVFDLRMRQGGAFVSNPEERFPVNYARDPVTGEVASLNIIKRERLAGRSIFQMGQQQGYGLSVRGGLDGVNYFASVDHDRDAGAELDNFVRRTTGRVNLSLFPDPRLDILASIGLTLSRTSLSGVESQTGGPGSTGGEILWSDPLAVDGPSRGFRFAPPEVNRGASERLQPVNHSISSLQLRHRPFSWLDHRLTAGIDIVDQTTEWTIPFMSPEVAQFFSPFWASGVKDFYVNDTRTATFDYGATGRAVIGGPLTSATSTGLQVYYRRSDFSRIRGVGFPGPGVTAISGAASTDQAEEGNIRSTTVGVYVQQELGWRNRLFLTGALRGDDNSSFGKDFDFVVYPKLSASWVISEEPFWGRDFVDKLKLRAAFGVAGQQPDAFSATRTFRGITGGGDQPGVTPGNFGNPDLRPERTRELEVGFEAGLFDGHLGIDFTYYNQRTTDALLLRDVAPSLGFGGTQQFFNAGRVSNTGFEVLLTGRPVASRSIGVDFTLNLSTNRNRVVDLGIPGAEFVETGWIPNRHQPGLPASSFFSKRVVSAERDGAGNVVNALCDGGEGSAPVPCDEAPFVFAGQPNPDWEGSFETAVTLFGNLRLSGLLDLKQGLSTYSWGEYTRCVSYGVCEENVYPERFSAEHIAALELSSNFEGNSFINDRSYVKLREVSLGYALPSGWVRAMGVSRAVVTLSGRNLKTWTSYRGLDPENQVTRPGAYDQNSPWDDSQLPALAQFVTSINLTF